MSKRKWKLPAMSLLLFLVLLADGALAGTVFAIARHQSGTFQSSTIQASTAQPRQVALTFDDGPHQTCTPALLDGLKQRGVKATFSSWEKILPEKNYWYSGCRRRDTLSAITATATSR